MHSRFESTIHKINPPLQLKNVRIKAEKGQTRAAIMDVTVDFVGSFPHHLTDLHGKVYMWRGISLLGGQSVTVNLFTITDNPQVLYNRDNEWIVSNGQSVPYELANDNIRFWTRWSKSWTWAEKILGNPLADKAGIYGYEWPESLIKTYENARKSKYGKALTCLDAISQAIEIWILMGEQELTPEEFAAAWDATL